LLARDLDDRERDPRGKSGGRRKARVPASNHYVREDSMSNRKTAAGKIQVKT